MLIRSQDKYSIINFDVVDRLRLSERRERGVVKEHYQTDVYYLTKNEAGILGTYSTEKKALKVLDMIQSAYNAIETMKIDKQAWKDNHYFEMPQDSEV